MLHNRRYKVEGGKLLKNFKGEQEGWFIAKADAWADVQTDIPARDNAGQFVADDPATPEKDESKVVKKPRKRKAS